MSKEEIPFVEIHDQSYQDNGLEGYLISEEEALEFLQLRKQDEYTKSDNFYHEKSFNLGMAQNIEELERLRRNEKIMHTALEQLKNHQTCDLYALRAITTTALQEIKK